LYRIPVYLQAALESASTIVTAHSRQAFAIRSAWGEHQRQLGRTAWPTPDVLPLSAWLARHWSHALDEDARAELPLLLDPIQERMHWEQIVAASAREWSLLHPHGASSAAWRTWQRVHDWAIDLRSLDRAPSEETRAFLGWSERAAREMREGGWIDSARALWQAPTSSADDLPSGLLAVGFDEETPARRAWLERLAARGVTVHDVPQRAPLGGAVKAGFADSDAELQAAARWARRRLERSPSDRLLIAIPRLDAQRARVERIFTEILDPAALLVGSSAGAAHVAPFALEESLALDRYPLVATALTALELASGRVAFDAVSHWLRSPHWLNGTAGAAARGRLDAYLRRICAPELDLAALLSALANSSLREQEASTTAALRRFADELRGTLTPSAWSAAFSRALLALGWPGDRALDSAEFQTLEKFNEALGTLATLDRLVGRVDLGNAVHYLRRLLEQVRFQPETGDTPVTVTARVGDPVLVYDGIWISGLHASAWPEPPRPDPFIPWHVQAAAGIPGASARGLLERANRTLASWLASAPELILSWPSRLDEESCDPSPLIAAFADAAFPDDDSPRYTLVIHSAAARERLLDETAPPLPVGIPFRGGARALRLQSSCPFRANAEQRLAAQPLEQPEPGIDARTRGMLIHRALEQIWTALADSTGLRGRSAAERTALIDESVSAASRSVLERGRRWSVATRTIELERLRELLQRWLEIEAQRDPFKVLALERRFDCNVGGLAFSLRVDRLDELGDGRQVLIDYKSGQADTKDWWGERPADPQIPLYAQVLLEAPGALAYAMLSAEECRFAGVSSTPVAIGGLATVRDWPAQLAEWRTVVERLASEFLSGRAAVDPLPLACSTCHLQAFCRIDELRGRSTRVDGDE
jgi:probable DNA repair protein